MKSKIFSTLTALLLICGIAISPSIHAVSMNVEFTDVTENKAYYEAVQSLTSRGYINGYPDGTFQPAGNVTRGQAAKIIANVLQLDIANVKDPNFKDIPISHQYYGHIAALVEADVISGYEDGMFRANATMSRAHMSKMLSKGFSLKEPELNFESPFKDVTSKHWFAPFVESLRIYNITTGTTPTTYSPSATVTRSQLASFVIRSEKVVELEKDKEDFVVESIE